MKKLGLGILIGIVVLTLSGIATASLMIPAPERARKVAIAPEKSPAIGENWALEAPGLEKIEFIHWKKDFVKAPAKAPKTPSCYKFLTPGKNPIKW